MAKKAPPIPVDLPHWQREYEALITETDEKLLPERAIALEMALFNRAQDLAKDFDTTAEQAAIQAAVKKLRRVQEEKLGFPKWGVACLSEVLPDLGRASTKHE